MRLLSTLKYYGAATWNHYDLILWLAHNRLRRAQLAAEQRRPDGTARPPRCITLKPTLACNLRCRMCNYAASGEVGSSRARLTPDVWRDLLDQVRPSRPYITITGGEPLLYPEIERLIREVTGRGLICTMTTNGTMLERQAEALVSSRLHALAVSIDGPGEVHDAIRGRPGTHEQVLRGIAAVQASRRGRRGLRHMKPFLIVTCAITRYNYEHIEEVAGLAVKAGADAVNFQHQWSLTYRMVEEHNRRYGDVHSVAPHEWGALDPPDVDAGAIAEAVRRVRRLGRVISGRTHVTFQPGLDEAEVKDWYADPHQWVRRALPACAWAHVDIMPDGGVLLCPGLVVGNITSERFADLWNGPAARAHRLRLAAAGGFPICARCCVYHRRD